MITNANEIKFRSSGMGYLLTDGKEKQPLEKYWDAISDVKRLKAEYEEISNKQTKIAEKKKEQIQKANTNLLILEKEKDDFQPSATCEKALIRVFAQTRGRYEELSNKYLTKGNERENDSITLLSRVLRKHYKKNKERKSNEYIQGEWDLHDIIDGVIVETLDTKSSWSYITFLEAQEKTLNPIYRIQGHCYMWLTGAKKHTVCYCLVNGTYKYIKDQIRSLQWKHGVLDGDISEDQNYLEAVKQLERNHIFDIDSFIKENPEFIPLNDVWFNQKLDQYMWHYDIPKEERVYSITFERDEEVIEKIKQRVINCRKYMNHKFFKIAA